MKHRDCYSEIVEKRSCFVKNCTVPATDEILPTKAAKASSQFLDAFNATNLIDRNTSTDFYVGSCFMTNKDKRPWVAIQLKDLSYISAVTLYNRMDCCSSRLNNAVVSIGHHRNLTQCGTLGLMEDVPMKKIDCGQLIIGDFIYIQVKGPQFLSLCEVITHGKKVTNVALNSNITSIFNTADVKFLVDGNYTVSLFRSYHSNAWVKIDLPRTAIIYEVRLISHRYYRSDILSVDIKTARGLKRCSNMTGEMIDTGSYYRSTVKCDKLKGYGATIRINNRGGFRYYLSEIEINGYFK